MRQQLRYVFALDRASLLSIASHRVEFFVSHQFHLNLSMDTVAPRCWFLFCPAAALSLYFDPNYA